MIHRISFARSCASRIIFSAFYRLWSYPSSYLSRVATSALRNEILSLALPTAFPLSFTRNSYKSPSALNLRLTSGIASSAIWTRSRIISIRIRCMYRLAFNGQQRRSRQRRRWMEDLRVKNPEDPPATSIATFELCFKHGENIFRSCYSRGLCMHAEDGPINVRFLREGVYWTSWGIINQDSVLVA